MDKIIAWLKSKNITSHTIAVAAATVFSFYVFDADVQNYVNALFANHPKVLGGLAFAVSLYLKYSHSSKPKPQGGTQ